jgi:hypothetical protein
MHQFLAANINLIIIFFIYVHLLTCGSFFFSDEWIHTTGMDDASLTSQYPRPPYYPTTTLPPHPAVPAATLALAAAVSPASPIDRSPRQRTQ